MKNIILIGLIFFVFLALVFTAIVSIINPFINNELNNSPIIGGSRDAYGCLNSAGYSWNSSLNICLREWELTNESERELIKNSILHLSYRITLISLEKKDCLGCYKINLERNDNQERIEINIFNGTISKENENKIFCNQNQRNVEICTMDYNPVCGYFNDSIKCIKYPCAETYSNPCIACSNPSVEYYIPGSCPN